VEDNPFFAGGRWLSALRKPWRRAPVPAPEGLQVWVSHLEEEARQDGLDRNRLKAEVEWRLAMAGIPVFYQRAGSGVPTFPCLGVLLHLRKADVNPPFYTFSVEVFFVQSHSSEEHPATRSMQMTWCQETIGDISVTSQGADWSGLLGQVGHMVEAFIRDYQAVHPPSRRSFMIN
jgi:hypothetical protein